MDDWESVDCTFITSSDKAILINDGQQDTWVPKSLIDEEHLESVEYAERGDEIELSIQGWFARQEDLA